MRIVEAKWVDSMADGEWLPKEDAISRATKDVMIHSSVGYLIHDNDDMILLTGSIGVSNGNVCGTIQIPREAIISIHDLYVSE